MTFILACRFKYTVYRYTQGLVLGFPDMSQMKSNTQTAQRLGHDTDARNIVTLKWDESKHFFYTSKLMHILDINHCTCKVLAGTRLTCVKILHMLHYRCNAHLVHSNSIQLNDLRMYMRHAKKSISLTRTSNIWRFGAYSSVDNSPNVLQKLPINIIYGELLWNTNFPNVY